MSAIKIVFFDIDGTLIDMNKKRISEKMLETLRRLKENGTIICIATGRSPIALPHFEGVEFDVNKLIDMIKHLDEPYYNGQYLK